MQKNPVLLQDFVIIGTKQGKMMYFCIIIEVHRRNDRENGHIG